MNTRDDELMQVLCGEMRSADLSDEGDRARVQSGENALHSALSAPAFDRDMLRNALKRIDNEQQPRPSIQSRTWVAPNATSRAWLAIAAMLAIVATGVVIYRSIAPTVPSPKGPKVATTEVKRQPDGSWRVGETQSIS